MPLPGQERLGKRNQFASVHQWLDDKVSYDKVTGGLWRVHNKIYDLSAFVDSHPGGGHWLSRTKGMDITDFYETHHIDTDKCDAVLAKYFVEEEKINIPQPFIYSKDNLYGRVKSKVTKLLKNQSSRDSSVWMYLFVGLWLMLWIGSLAWLYTSNSWLSIIVYSYVLYVMIGIGHNYSHRNNKLSFAMDLTGYPQHSWTISHCLSHHNYTNLEMDLEIIAFQPFLYFLSSQPQNWYISIVLQYVVLFMSPFLLFLESTIDTIMGKNKMRLGQLIFPLQFIIGYYLHGFSGFLSMLIAHGLSGILLTSFTFPVHRTENVWTQGDPNPTRDFGIHILNTTRDHNQDMSIFSSMLLFEGFTDHVAHHMFPTVDRSKLHLINPLIRQTCQQMNLQHLYPEHQYRDLLSGYFPFFVRGKTAK